MPSRALREWRTTQRAELDRLDAQVRRVGGPGTEDRAVRRQLVDAGIVLLAGHFQLCCRDLYEEASGFLVAQVRPPAAAGVVEQLLRERPALSRANAHPDVIARDFRRLGLELWDEIEQRDPFARERKRGLKQLNIWRNAIAHQDYELSPDQVKEIDGTGRDVRSMRTWRRHCSALVPEIDAVLKHHLSNVAGRRPW